MSESVIRLDLDCLLIESNAFSKQPFSPLRSRFISSLIEIVKALQIGFVRSGIDRVGASKIRLLLRHQLDFDFTGNSSSHRALQRQNVAQIALVAFGPKVLVSCGADK